MAYHSKYTGAEVDALLDKIKDDDVGDIDSSLSTESENPVMNKVITVELNNKADKGKVTAALNTKADKSETDTKLAKLSAETEVLKEAQQFTDVAVKDLQDMKIDRENDDYYPKMAVGLADNLAGVDVVDSEINFRRSGGGAITDGVARIESIKGNSVVWNQLLKVRTNKTQTKEGVSVVDNQDGSYTISGENTSSADVRIVLYTNYSVQGGHKAMLIGAPSSSSNTTFYLEEGYTGYRDVGKGVIFALSSANGAEATAVVKPGAVISSVTFRPLLFDLTKMFGAGNEPTTIEEFYARIPMGVDMNAYNEGEVIHMNVQSIESVGVNQWDEEWELGGLSANGLSVEATNRIRSKNFIPVVPHKAYYVSKALIMFYYDINHNIISYEAIGAGAPPIPSNCYYIKFYEYGVTTYNHDICINLSDTAINGKYFPYIKRQEDLSLVRKYFPDGMKSAGTAHDEIRYNKASGKREKVVRIKETDFSRASAYSSVENTFMLPIADMKLPTTTAERGQGLLCAKYPMHGGADGLNVAAMEDKSMLRMNNGNIYIKDSAFGSDATAFKAAMAGVILYYELAEPIITELDEVDQFKDLDYQVWNAGTEKAIAEGKSAPLAADITYGFNAIGKIKELESLVAALRAKVGI